MKRFKSIAMAAFAVIVAAAYAVPALPAYAASSASLSIAPKKNYLIEPGKTQKDKLTIRNLDSKIPLQLTLRVVDFSFTDDTGTPKLMLDPNAPLTTWSLKPFLKLPETVTIQPSSSKSIDMSVSIPAGHGAGSYYSAIVYQAGPPGSGGNVGLSASGVTLVFTQIPGQVNEDLKLEKFGAYRVATATKPAEYLFVAPDEPQHIAYTLKNNGNVTEAPVGSIKLNDMWGHTITIDKVNPNNSLALIGQSRTFTACIKLAVESVELGGTKTPANTCVSPGLWPGLYTASLDLFYGQNGNQTREITSTTSFWYLPWWFLAIVAIILLIIVYIIWRLVRAIRGHSGGSTRFKGSSRRR